MDVLLDALQLCDDAMNGATPGTFVGSTAEAGGSVAFQIVQGWTPIDARRAIGELIDFAEKVITAIGGDPSDANSYQDADLFAAIMKSLVKVTRYRNDYTGLRYGVGYYIGA